MECNLVMESNFIFSNDLSYVCSFFSLSFCAASANWDENFKILKKWNVGFLEYGVGLGVILSDDVKKVFINGSRFTRPIKDCRMGKGVKLSVWFETSLNFETYFMSRKSYLNKLVAKLGFGVCKLVLSPNMLRSLQKDAENISKSSKIFVICKKNQKNKKPRT